MTQLVHASIILTGALIVFMALVATRLNSYEWVFTLLGFTLTTTIIATRIN